MTGNEFYVFYEWLGLPYIGVVDAPEEPPAREFADYWEMHHAMDALGHNWELKLETPEPFEYAFDDARVWQHQIAETLSIAMVAEPINKIPEWKYKLPGLR